MLCDVNFSFWPKRCTNLKTKTKEKRHEKQNFFIATKTYFNVALQTKIKALIKTNKGNLIILTGVKLTLRGADPLFQVLGAWSTKKAKEI